MIVQTNSKAPFPGLKKRAALIAAGLTVAVVLGLNSLVGPGVASASADSAALVIDGFGCGLLDGNGRIVRAESSHSVITQSANGNRVLKCSVKGVDNRTGKAAHFDYESTGYLCNAKGVLTKNWTNKVSKSGNSTLTCLVS